MNVAQAISGIIIALTGLIATGAGAFGLLRRSGYGRTKEDARELEARSEHQRVQARVIRDLRDRMANCGCDEPKGLDERLKWDYQRNEEDEPAE